eukprot:c24690_g1_i1 orf=187-2187(-)
MVLQMSTLPTVGCSSSQFQLRLDARDCSGFFKTSAADLGAVHFRLNRDGSFLGRMLELKASPIRKCKLMHAVVTKASHGVDSKEDEVEETAIESLERAILEKKQAEISNRILSGEFTAGLPIVDLTGRGQLLLNLGAPGRFLVQKLGEFQRKLKEEKENRLPEVKGNVKAIMGQAFFITLFTLFQRYGEAFRLTFGPKSFVIISDSKIAKHILKDNSKAYSKGILAEILEFVMGKGLIPADAEIWQVRRRAIVPSLHRKFVAAMLNHFGQATEVLCKKLDAAASNGEDVEMESLFSHLTLDIIGKAVFNYNFDSLSNGTGIVEAVYIALREAETRSMAVIPYWNIPLVKYVSPRQHKVAGALKLINETLDDLTMRCKRMVEEERVNFHEEYLHDSDPSILHFLLASGDDVSSKQLRDDLMTLLIAGHETSAALLTWAFYLLAKNPKFMSKLQCEVDSVLGDRVPTVEDVKKLKLTTRIINETLRLYPQPPVLIRRSLQDDVLGKYPIKRGEDIFISVWNIHRSPQLWEDPEEFKPDRWALDGPDPNEATENFRYLPFGGGPRKCVGDLFATFEAITAVAMLVRRFNFELAVNAPPVGMTTGATIHTTAGLHMTVTCRSRPPTIPITDGLTLTKINKTEPIDNCQNSIGPVRVSTHTKDMQGDLSRK